MPVKEMAKIFQKKKGMDISIKKLINSIGAMSANTVKMDETVDTFENSNNLHENTFDSKTLILLECPASLQMTNTDIIFTFIFKVDREGSVKSPRMPSFPKSTVKEGSELPVTRSMDTRGKPLLFGTQR